MGVTLLAAGRRALSGADDRTLRRWDLEAGVELARLTFDAAVSAIASSPHGPAVVGDVHGSVHVIELIE